jgi:hypothetical protein
MKRKNPYDTDQAESLTTVSSRLADYLPEDLSIEQRGEARIIGDMMGKAYAERQRGFQRILSDRTLPADAPLRAELTPEVIHERSSRADASPEHIEYLLNSKPLERITWADLSAIYAKDQNLAPEIFRALKRAAREKLAAGMIPAGAIQADKTPYSRAKFSVVLECFSNAWEPKNAIEAAMVETLAQSYMCYNRWLSIATSAADREYDVESQAEDNYDGKWNPPRMSVSEMVEQAISMADRYNRLFLRTLRQMRDLRRYPVVINNMGGQVNVAADGGKQINALKAE